MNTMATKKSHGAIKLTENKGFCILPFTGVFIQNNRIRLCCESKEDTKHYLSGDSSISDIWNNQFYQDTRTEMLAGNLPAGCSTCRMDEAAGEESMRLWENSQIDNIDEYTDIICAAPSGFDVRPTNKCNLECVMCDGGASTAINSRLVYHNKDVTGFPIQAGKVWEENRFVINHIQQNSDKITTMRFAGGEPFLMPEVLEIIDYLVSTGESKNIKLRFTTNGTVVRNKWFSEKLVKFKSVKLNVSIDAIGEIGEYVRYPCKWSVVDKNMQLFKKIAKNNPHITISLAPVIHVLTALDMDKVIEYAAINKIDLALTPVYAAAGGGNHLSTELLTDELKQLAYDKIMNVLARYPNMDFNIGKKFITQLLSTPQLTDATTIQQLNKVIRYWDSHRKVKFLEQYPYLDYLIE